jgi:hypothetical protein
MPYQLNSIFLRFAVTCAAAAGLAMAQDQAPPTPPQSPAQQNGAWRRVGDAPPAPPQTPSPSQPTDAYGQPLPAGGAQPAPAPGEPQDVQQGPPQDTPPAYAPPNMAPQNMPQNVPQNGPPPQQANGRPAYGLPAQVTLQPGTYVTARINQALSSDHNLVGDTFTGTLLQPVVVNGIVVAQRGQTVYGRVTVVEKHHSDKPSRLGLELTGMTLADGTQVPVKSELVTRQGRTTPGGVEAGTVVGTTAVGAAIGGAVGWGTGAAIGAGAGAIAGLAGVFATHNHATVLYPETVLMFQVSAPLTVATGNGQAFHYVGPNEYGNGPGVQMQMQQPRPPGYGYSSYAPYGGYAPYGYPYAYPYYGYGYPYWGGGGFYFGGPRVFVGGRGFGRRR